MQIGLMKAPMHWRDLHWQNQLDQAIETAGLADDLGFSEAYFGSVFGDGAGGLNPSTLLLSKLAESTKNLKVGIDAAMLGAPIIESLAQTISILDQLLDGRLFLGLTPENVAKLQKTGVRNGTYQTHPDDISCALEQLLAHWRSTAPNFSYGLQGRARLAHGGVIDMPVQQPHPRILAFSALGDVAPAEDAAFKGYSPVSASWLHPEIVAGHWPALVAGATRAARRVDPTSWRVARSIFVCDDQKLADEYVTGSKSPYRRHYEYVHQHIGVKIDVDLVLDRFVIRGPARKVADELMALEQTTGPIGTLLYVDPLWVDRNLARSSMIKMAEGVMQMVNAGQNVETRKLERI